MNSKLEPSAKEHLSMLFFYAFLKWMKTKKSDFYSASSNLDKYLSGDEAIEAIDKRLEDMSYEYDEGDYPRYSSELFQIIPFDDSDLSTVGLFYVINNFNVSISAARVQSIDEYYLSFDIKYSGVYNKYNLDSAMPLEKYITNLFDKLLSKSYDDGLEYYFNESLFEELFNKIRSVHIEQLRLEIINCQ
jgi:hypothetical protein